MLLESLSVDKLRGLRNFEGTLPQLVINPREWEWIYEIDILHAKRYFNLAYFIEKLWMWFINNFCGTEANVMKIASLFLVLGFIIQILFGQIASLDFIFVQENDYFLPMQKMIICHFVLSFLAVQMTNRQVAEKRWVSPTHHPVIKCKNCLHEWPSEIQKSAFMHVYKIWKYPYHFQMFLKYYFSVFVNLKILFRFYAAVLEFALFFVVPLNSFSWNFLRIEIKWTFHLHFYANQAIANRGGHSPICQLVVNRIWPRFSHFFHLWFYKTVWWHSDSLGRKNSMIQFTWANSHGIQTCVTKGLD